MKKSPTQLLMQKTLNKFTNSCCVTTLLVDGDLTTFLLRYFNNDLLRSTKKCGKHEIMCLPLNIGEFKESFSL